MVLNGYNLAGELVAFAIMCLMMFSAFVTKPKRTRILRIVLAGFALSSIAIMLNIHIIRLISFRNVFGGVAYKLLCAIYFATILVVFNLIFSYVHLLSSKNKNERTILNVFSALFFVSYIITIGTKLILGTMFGFNADGSGYLTSDFYAYVYFGYICVVMISVSVYLNRMYLPRIIMNFISLLSVLLIALLTIQLIYPDSIVIGMAYSLPFVVYYILFHSIYFDEATGCQSVEAFYSHIIHLNKIKRPYDIVVVSFPRMQASENVELHTAMDEMVKTSCYDLGRMVPDSRVYRLNDFTFGIVLQRGNEKVCNAYVNDIYSYMERVMFKWDKTRSPEYKMIAFRSHANIATINEFKNFVVYLYERAVLTKSTFYLATNADYEAAIKRHNIENELIDIRNKYDLNDPRVVVYVQPIYNVVTKQFKTAEALMRLDYNGELIKPSDFIPIAERNGCIHALTRIILNKVCETIHSLQETHQFDAISVNVSTTEFGDYNLHEELLRIIEANQIDCSKIRLELTESAMLSDIDTISFNMERFTEAGVTFYLDDFGTGYSNLERIMTLPFSTIKFDKSILYKALDNETLESVMDSLVSVFKKHNLVVLAEGVEDDKQADYTIRAGFDYIQGYNFAVPVPIDELKNYFEKK